MKQEVSRKNLLSVYLKQSVSNIQIKEVTIPPGEKGAYHTHLCSVVGYISYGKALYKIEGQEPQILVQGSAFYEPRNVPILHFDNASTTEPLTFIAFYLREQEEDFITLLS